jgi:tRNA(adenine34) deaminase
MASLPGGDAAVPASLQYLAGMIGPNSDEHYMRTALREAQQAYDSAEVPVGAIVVWGDKIIGRGHNQVERLSDSTAHAEMIALTAAFSSMGAKYLSEATIYVTVEPCLMCCGAMYWSKIGRIVYGAEDIKNGYRKFTGATFPFHPKAELLSGILGEECATLMKDFFAARR